MAGETRGWSAKLRSLWTGLALHCPNCGQGRMFRGLMAMNTHCAVCGVRFERRSGESVGGMYLNLGIAEMLAIPGFLIVDAIWHPPFVPHLLFWLVFTVVFCLLFYRHARGLWVAITYLTGGVQTDAEYEEARGNRPQVRSPFRDR